MLISIRDALINAHNLRSDGDKRVGGVINFKVRAAEDSCCYIRAGRRNQRCATQPQRLLPYVIKEDKQGVRAVSFLKWENAPTADNFAQTEGMERMA